MKKRLATIASLFLLVVVSVSSPFAQSAPNADAEKAIRAQRAGFVAAIRSHEFDKALDYIAADGVFLTRGAPLLEGRENIRPVVRELQQRGSHRDLEMHTQRLEITGKMAFEIGRYTFLYSGEDGADRAVAGKYLDVWRLDADGQWRIAVHAPMADPPPPPADKK